MQKLNSCLIALCIMFNCYLIYAQEDITMNDYIINFNYQNELRIEWPSGTYSWSLRNLESSISTTQKFAKFIISNINEINLELSSGNALDIKIYEFGGLTKMEINKSSRPITYVYKDSLLLFTGINCIYLIQEDLQPVSISFDDANSLSHLGLLDFGSIQASLKKDLRSEPIFSKRKLDKLTELYYHQENEVLHFAGQLHEKTKRSYGIRGLFGANLIPGNLGISATPEFIIANFKINKAGESIIANKHAFMLRTSIFEKFGTMSLKYAKLSTARVGDELIMYGLGIGMFQQKNWEGNQSVFGPATSMHGEGKRVFTEIELRFPVNNLTSLPTLFLNLVVGFKF